MRLHTLVCLHSSSEIFPTLANTQIQYLYRVDVNTYTFKQIYQNTYMYTYMYRSCTILDSITMTIQYTAEAHFQKCSFQITGVLNSTKTTDNLVGPDRDIFRSCSVLEIVSMSN